MKRATTLRRAAMTVAASLTLFPFGAAAGNSSEAERLFAEGRQLLKDGRVSEACEALAKSQRLDPSAGTMLNLADCHEREGKLATAWKEFSAAEEAARARGRADWVDLARTHSNKLKARLPRIVFRFSGPSVATAIDGEAVARADLGSEIFVDPGAHTVVAETGLHPFQQHVSLKEGELVTVVVPSPASEPKGVIATTVVQPPPTERPRPEGPPVLALTLFGVGGAALIFGGVAGLVAQGKASDAKSACPALRDSNAPEPILCPPGAVASNDSAFTWATLSTVSFVGGAVLAGGGLAALLLLDRPQKKTSAFPAPYVTQDGFGATMRVKF